MLETAKDNNLNNIHAWGAVLCGAFFYFYQFVIRVSPNIIHDELVHDFSIKKATTFGTIVCSYYIAYSLILIPLGIAMDRFGVRRLLAGSALLCAIGCYVFGSTSSSMTASCARFMMGLGAACGFLGTLKLGTLWLHPRKIGKVIAITMVFGTLGATAGGVPLRILIEVTGWRETMFILGHLGVLISIFVILIVGKPPSEKKIIKEAKKGAWVSHLSGLGQVIHSPQIWLIGIVGMLMYVPITTMGIAWGVPYLQSYYNLDQKIAVSFVSAMFIGAAVGGPFFTSLSDLLLKRKAPLILGTSIALITHFTIIFVHNIPITIMYVLFFIAGFSYTSKCLCFASITESIPRQYSGVAIGFANTLVMITGVIYHPIIGKLLDYSYEKGTFPPVYSLNNYCFALSIIPIGIVASLIILYFIKETYPGRYLSRKKKTNKP